MKKTLEKNSRFTKADTNGDNIVSDDELNAELDREERRLKMENADKREDQVRYLIWFSAITVTIFIAVLTVPGWIPHEKLNDLSGIGSTWVISQMGILATYIGASAWSKTKETK